MELQQAEILHGSGHLKEGDYVNCERAMAGHTRFGGHMVQVSLSSQLNKDYLVECSINDSRATSIQQQR